MVLHERSNVPLTDRATIDPSHQFDRKVGASWRSSESKDTRRKTGTFNLEKATLHPDKNAMAMVTPIYGRKVARLRFSDDFLTLSRQDQRHAITHELVHCHVEGMAQLVTMQTKALGNVAFDQLWDAFHQELERAVDGIATDWAHVLPLPDKAIPHNEHTTMIVPFHEVPPDEDD